MELHATIAALNGLIFTRNGRLTRRHKLDVSFTVANRRNGTIVKVIRNVSQYAPRKSPNRTIPVDFSTRRIKLEAHVPSNILNLKTLLGANLQDIVRSASCILAASVAAAVVLQGDFPAGADLPTEFALREAEVETVKNSLIAAWNIVNETYVDYTFNDQNWEVKLQETLVEISALHSKEEAYAKIQGMLATLEDPYTRIISPKEYESFQISKDGSLNGVGLLLTSERDTGHLVVVSPIKDGPAARAGILSGDELIQINGQSVSGMNSQEAATQLRGRVGTPVTLKFHRKGGGDKAGKADSKDIKISLLRETISLSPVSMAVLSHTLPDGHRMKAGYIHLSSFSQNAADEMEKAILLLEQEGADSYILDLRNNPGGLVRAGLEVAQLWLDGNKTIVNTFDQHGNMEPIRLEDSHPLTKDPLIVLINGDSASASEILAGALHDNDRAALLGQRSFGKGKIQSVTKLEDGSALFVTIAKYLSPSLHEIDKVGIEPDALCAPGDTGLPLTSAGSIMESSDDSVVQMLERDSCVVAAEKRLGILPS